ncbi:Replication protein A subunit [Paragonimus heterotremus]|uniref:Replication protein A subunit n=1 Tax=Paragonimus heterotremus TaxID=100268 RepID=A0A8J4X278_9TREM|nr:Replication protein A subunit [Paragonimus heterotremus]
MQTLTSGAIDLINSGKNVHEPVLKVLGYKVVPGGSGGQNRYRLLLSDGVKTHSCNIGFAMLATQLNHLIENGDLVNDTVVRIKKYVCNNVQNNKYVLIVLDVELLGVDHDSVSTRPPFRTVSDNAAVVNKPATVTTTIATAPFTGTSHLKPEVNGLKTPPKSATGPFPTGAHPSTPGTPGSGLAKVFPIQSLNPYQNRWTVRARVSQKSSIRTWNKQGRDGKLFSFTIVDESGEIRVTAFNAEVDRFFDMIEVNKPYYFTRAHLKAANKQFNTTNNEYEMTLHADSQITPCEDEDTSELPQTHFNFVPIGKLDTCEQGSFVDVVGIVHEAGEMQTIMAKTSQRELRKRELGLVDSSQCLVRLTLWGEEAENFDGSRHPAIVIKGAKVSDFNGRSLSVSTTSTVMVAPTNVPEAIRLKGWYEHEGRLANFETYKSEMVSSTSGGDSGSAGGGCLSGWHLTQDVKASGVGTNAKADYFCCKGTVVFLKKENFMYQACPTDGCNKKVVDLGNGLYRCEKCARETPNCKWRLLLTVKIADMTGDLWVTCFQDAAEQLLGQTADSLGEMKQLQDENQLERVFMNAVFNSWVFRLRAKVDRYNDEERLRVVVADVKPLDHVEYARRLAKAISSLAPSLPSELVDFS